MPNSKIPILIKYLTQRCREHRELSQNKKTKFLNCPMISLSSPTKKRVGRHWLCGWVDTKNEGNVTMER
jgi:hypothetical protein